MRPTIVVGGALANKLGSGGEAWVRLSWIRGLQGLGFDVWFVEQMEAPGPDHLAYYDRVVAEFDLAGRAVLITAEGSIRGPDVETLGTIAETSALINISGHIDLMPLLAKFRTRVFVDIDPGFTQSWYAAGLAGARLDGHDHHVTIAEEIGRSGCLVPTCGFSWKTVRQPVVLDDWPVHEPTQRAGFTTVGSWRGPFGPVTIDRRTYGLKVHEFRALIELPSRSRHDFELALDIHPADEPDRQRLLENGWKLVDPRDAAFDPDRFRAYVQGSAAEFSVAQGVYVGTRSGWFSDRSVRYLASGRPALVQDTGFSRTLPCGNGLVPFTGLADAVTGADDIIARYDEHAAAARELAARHFDAGIVLARLCEQCGIV